MIFRIATFLALGLALVTGVCAAPTLPLQDGERLTYRVSWAIVPGAGEINISAKQDGADRLIVTTTTATRRLAKMLLPFEAEAKSIFDLNTGQLLSLRETSVTK